MSETEGALPDTSPFEDLVARALEAVDKGGEAALAALLEQHPDKAAEVRAAVERLAGIGLVGDGDAPDREFPERLGDFRLLRRIGGGGMGVVFLALQEPLGREFAIKLVRPDYVYFADARERFRREVQAVARLKHPGIVPVSHVGEESGLPYFAMEFIQGCSLAEMLEAVRGHSESTGESTRKGRAMSAAIRGLVDGGDSSRGGEELFAGSWEVACLRITLAVADAMCHAHERQIIHRDLKPSNVMVTADGQVRIVDFGLAWLETEERITKSNSILGSINYMSPEQITEASVDQRTDVYSLGATLYELLGLKTPFGRGDVITVRERILQGRLTPVRKLNPTISRDTETICEKAMAARREHRYASMAELADDLRNLLELRPIMARPPSISRRATRWVQRNTVLSLGILLLFVLVISMATLWWQQRAANDRLQVAKNVSDANLLLAQENLQLAKTAIDRMLTRVAGDGLRHVPLLTPVRAKLFEDASALYAELANRQEDADVQRELAAMHLRMGFLQTNAGDLEKAAGHLRSAVERFAALREARSPDEGADGQRLRDDATCHYAVSLGRLAHLYELQGEPKQALASFELALDAMEPLRERLGGQPSYLTELAALYRLVANFYGRSPELRGSDDRAQRNYDELTIGLSREVVRLRPDDRGARESLARELRRLGARLTRAGEYEKALAEFRGALECYAELETEQELSASMLNSQSMVHEAIADLHRRTREYEKSLAALQKELAIRRRVTEQFPAYIEYLGNMGATLYNLAAIQLTLGDSVAAEKSLREAIANQPKVDAQLPNHPVFRRYRFPMAVSLCRALTHQMKYRAVAKEALRLPERTADARVGALATAEWLCHAITACRHAEAEITEPLDRWIREQQDAALSHLERAAKAGAIRRRTLARPAFAPIATHRRFAAVQAKAID